MALTYTGSTGLFTRIGKLVKASNARLTTQVTDLPAEQAYIAAVFDAAARDDQIAALAADYQGFQDGQTKIRQRVASYADKVIADRVEVLNAIGLTNGSINATFWEAFLRQMSLDAASVASTTTTIGTVTAGGVNVGTGTVLLTAKLDGINPPVRGGPACRWFAGLLSELASVSEAMQFKCTSGADTGAASGKESLQWTGGQNFPAFDWRGDGSGTGPTIRLAGDGGKVVDGDFEQWTATNTPTQWTIVAGTAGTHIKQGTGAGNFYRGVASLNLVGDGSLAAITLTQAIASKLTPMQMYGLSFRLKASSSVAAGDLTVSWAGTGYSPGAGETVAVAHGSLPTSWTLKNCFILAPVTIPSDLTLKITWASTPTNAKNVWIDSLALQPVAYHGGIGAVAIPGQTDPVRGDRWTSAISSDAGSKFNEFFRMRYDVQLPSSGSPTIGNALAT